jgi:hypothetical protein
VVSDPIQANTEWTSIIFQSKANSESGSVTVSKVECQWVNNVFQANSVWVSTVQCPANSVGLPSNSPPIQGEPVAYRVFQSQANSDWAMPFPKSSPIEFRMRWQRKKYHVSDFLYFNSFISLGVISRDPPGEIVKPIINLIFVIPL